jgi:hypothetical protein
MQSPIFIWIEELHHVIAVGLSHIMHTVISYKIEQLHRCNETILVSIYTLEYLVGLHVFIACEVLTFEFDVLLETRDF